ncbi:MAG TPA: hypothetical protein VJ455_00315 [Ignavibacteria bacterium]|nr:hypothetical protein [Ignavibacteria bacterium]
MGLKNQPKSTPSLCGWTGSEGIFMELTIKIIVIGIVLAVGYYAIKLLTSIYGN